MAQLSVVIITKNEEKNIARCLESVQELADEIVVVDSGSTDATKEICQKFGVKFVVNAFEGHVQQKNHALELATKELILSLDADEALDDDLKGEIRRIKETQEADVYILRRLNRYCGKWIKHGSWYPDKRVRLVKKGMAKWGGRNPHDKLLPLPSTQTAELKGHILHYTIDDLQGHLKQINYFSSLAAQSKYKAGVKYHWWQLAFNPPWRFVKEYLFKAGFLDGFMGLQIALLSAFSGYLRYAKLRELWKNVPNK